MHIAGKAVESVIDRDLELVKDTLRWSSDDANEQKVRLIVLARLAGLLHDIGHSPFSHTGEKKLFPDGISHEDLSAAIIRQTQVGVIIDQDCNQFGISKELVAQIGHRQPVDLDKERRNIDLR